MVLPALLLRVNMLLATTSLSLALSELVFFFSLDRRATDPSMAEPLRIHGKLGGLNRSISYVD